MGEKLSDVLARFVKNTKLEDIPPETILFTKELALKTLAGMIAGSQLEGGVPLVNYAKSVGGTPDAGVIGSKFKSSIESSILANGHFAHVAELEDDQFPSAASDITVFPVSFPMAQKYKVSGKAFVEANAVAHEVMCRIGMFSLSHQGITDLPYYGVIGAAVVAAKLLNLSEDQIKNAIGISIGRAAGFITNFGTDAHYCESSMACRDGYFAALMAQQGLTGTWDIEGWLKKVHGREDLPVSRVTEGLGTSRWHIHNIWIKKYPCCFLTHRQNDMLIAMKKKYGLTPDNIEKIEFEVGPIDVTCDRPSPKDIEDSRFSYQHIAAGIIIDGDLNYETFTNQKISDHTFKKVREKVKVIHRNDWTREFNSGVATVKVTLMDGRVLKDSAEQAIGGSKRPLTEDHFIDLYRKYSSRFLKESEMNESADIIMSLEKQQDLQRLMDVSTNGK